MEDRIIYLHSEPVATNISYRGAQEDCKQNDKTIHTRAKPSSSRFEVECNRNFRTLVQDLIINLSLIQGCILC
jgi:hypothetical protein